MEEVDDGLLMDTDSWDISYLYRVLAFKKIDGEAINKVKRDIYNPKSGWKLDARGSKKVNDSVLVKRIDDNDVRNSIIEPTLNENPTRNENKEVSNNPVQGKKLSAIEKARLKNEEKRKKLKTEN